MGFSRIGLAAAVFGTSCVISLAAAVPDVAHAATFTDIVGPGPGVSEEFGDHTLVLSNGNLVVVDPFYDFGNTDVGAVFLYDGSSPSDPPITSVFGLNDDDRIGYNGVYEVGNSNFVIVSSMADVGGIDGGAVTWVDGTNGVGPIPVFALNSLYGPTQDDHIGIDGIVTLTNGNYLVRSGDWTYDSPSDTGLGAVTWQPGNSSYVGQVDATNSLVGSTLEDSVGFSTFLGEPVVALSNGNFAVGTAGFDNGGDVDAGAVTWGDGTTGLPVGVLDSTNSIFGSAGDGIGVSVTPLTNGKYVVNSPNWNGGDGAATLLDGTGAPGPLTISSANSIIGGPGDGVGFDTVALTNNNYVVSSPVWNSGRGAVTLGVGAGGTHLVVDETNSLVGDVSGDLVGAGLFGELLMIPLANGNAVVGSPGWHSDRGAATLINGTTGVVGEINATNSLVGQRTNDVVGSSLVATSGGYAVGSPGWSTSTSTALGAVVLGDGSNGVVGNITLAGSLHGSTNGDRIGTSLTALANGNLVAGSPLWDVAGGASNVGALTWINGTSGLTGTPDATNSLVGVTASDHVGGDLVVPLVGGGYLAYSDDFDGPIPNGGAATYGGLRGAVGNPTASNSVLGDAISGVVISPCTCNAAGNKLLANGSTPVTRSANVVTLLLPDQTAPLLAQPGNISTSVLQGTPSAVVNFAVPTANDAQNSAGVPVGVTCDKASGASFPVGVTTVNCTAINEVGLTTTKSFTVTVTVEPVPAFTTNPSDITVPTAPGGSSAVVTYTTPAATDLNGAVPVNCAPASGSTFPVGDTTVTCSATNSFPHTTTTTFHVVVTATSPLADLIPLTPARLADTRQASTTADGLFAGIGAIGADSILELTVAGRAGVPADAVAAALNVTVTQPVGAGYVTVYPCGTPPPTASNLNYTAGDTIANAVMTKIGTGGKVCITSSQTTHLIVDVTGTVPPTSTFVALGPTRVLDTRITGNQAGTGSVTPLQIGGQAGIPSDAKAVVLNVTVTEPAAEGYATVYPCGAEPPTASNINYTAGLTIPNLVIAKLGTGGQVCIFSQQATHLVVDVAGYYPSTSVYVPLFPARLLDTRPTYPTIDNESAGIGLRTPGSITTLHVAGRGGVAAGAATVMLNVTVTSALGSGYVTVYPCGIAPPGSSNVNFTAGQTIANAVITKVGTGGNVCILSSQSTHVIADVTGYMPV